MINHSSKIENLNKKLNFKTNEIDRFKLYFNFIEENKKEFDDSYEIIKNILPLIMKKNKQNWLKEIKKKLDNNEDLFNFLITSIFFRNIINNSLLYNDIKLEDEKILKPFWIPRSHLIYKISKDLKGFIIFYNINTESIGHYELKKSIDVFSLNLISYFLEFENSPLILKTYNVVKKINKQNKNVIKTVIFFSFKKQIFYIDYISYSNFNFNKPYIKNFKGISYLIGDGFWNCDSIFKYNLRTNSRFKTKDILAVNKLISQKCFIDEDNLEFALKEIEKEESIDWKDLESNIFKIFIEISKCKSNDEEKINLSRKASKLLNYLNVVILKKLNLKKNQEIYFKVEFDFRGRSYYNSPLAVTYSKLNRFLYNFGLIKTKDINIKKIPLVEERINFSINLLNEICNYFKIEKNDNNLRIVYWVSISIGSFFIEKKEIVEDTEFLISSKNWLLNKIDKKLDIDERIQLYSYKNILKNLNEEFFKLSFISKDATASVIQNYMRILGPKNEKSLEFANINSGYKWNDPYSIIINYFLKKEQIEDLRIKKIFSRKNLKKTIMTVQYESTLLTCLKYFLEEIEKNNNFLNKEEFYKKEKERGEEVNNIINVFKKFYNFIKKDLDKELLYNEKSDDILKESSKILELNESKEGNYNIYLDIKIIENDIKYRLLMIRNDNKDSESNLAYYDEKTKYNDFKLKIVDKRVTREFKEPDLKIINKKKTKQSFKPNLLHFEDANYLRSVMKIIININVKFIHDCFLISVLDIPDLIIACNEVMYSGKIKEFCKEKKIFSIFILL